MGINSQSGSSIGFILVLFILLVIVIQCFPSNRGDIVNPQDEGEIGVLYTQGFDIVNNTDFIFNWGNYSGTAVNPTPSRTLNRNGGTQHFELTTPYFGADVSSTQAYSSRDSVLALRFTLGAGISLFGARYSSITSAASFYPVNFVVSPTRLIINNV
ncbi:hypothetical protein CGZ75_05185 [Paenibacillus herberti]|uniref:Uncharacterized protein n=1 Tax=Paenibacillus herberti TaxID=1619309 RepID=A0A229P203_9BACL|nr:hypothetical protein CGZ75_05185 [Paenibacillus herberti]